MCYSNELLYASLLTLHFLFFLLDRSIHLLQIATNTSRAQILQIIYLGHVEFRLQSGKMSKYLPRWFRSAQAQYWPLNKVGMRTFKRGPYPRMKES